MDAGVLIRVAEAEFSERKGLALFLLDYLSEGQTAMPGTQLAIRYAAASDIGRERDRNQDAAYAGTRLLAVADGWGPGGDAASEAFANSQRVLEVTNGRPPALRA